MAPKDCLAIRAADAQQKRMLAVVRRQWQNPCAILELDLNKWLEIRLNIKVYIQWLGKLSTNHPRDDTVSIHLNWDLGWRNRIGFTRPLELCWDDMVRVLVRKNKRMNIAEVSPRAL